MKKAKAFIWLEAAFVLPILFLFVFALVELRRDGLHRFRWARSQLQELSKATQNQVGACQEDTESRIFPENQRIYWRFQRDRPRGQMGFDCPKKKHPSLTP